MFIEIKHGSGGRPTQELIKEILGIYRDQSVNDLEDCALIENGIGVTIDGFTVSPRFFPGGDIGKLAICGSTNDLAVRGVKPNYVAVSFLIEEGLPKDELFRAVDSAYRVSKELDVKFIAGDTKVLPKGQADGIYITCCALGQSVTDRPWGVNELSPGDVIIATGPIGQHGALIAALRYGLDVDELESDCAPLWPLMEPLTKIPGVKCARDCTRGGLGTVLCEWAEGASLGIEIDEDLIPLTRQVISLADVLGFDVLHLACEGTAVIAVDPDCLHEVLSSLKEKAPLCTVIGKVTGEHPGIVGLKTSIGGMRVVDMPLGEMVPRIC